MRKEPTQSFKRKITFMFIIIATLPVIILGSFLLFYVGQSTQRSLNTAVNDAIETAHHSIADLIATTESDIDRFIDADVVRMMDDVRPLSDADASKLKHKMYNLMGSRYPMIEMYLLREDGSLSYGTNAVPDLYNLPKYQNWGIFREAKNQDGTVVYPMRHYSDSGKRNALSLIRPVRSHGKHVGYVVIDISSEMIQHVLLNVKTTSYGYIQYILTTANDFVIYNDSGFINSIDFVNNVFRADRFNPNTDDTLKEELEHRIMQSTLNPETGIQIYGLIDTEFMVTQNSALLFGIVGLAALVSCVSGYIGYRLSSKVSDPIVAMSQEIRGIRSLDDAPHFPIERDDEVGVIAREFTDLIARIDAYHQADLLKEKNVRLLEYKTLSSQMNPHFLHNTLDSIKWNAKLGERDAIVGMVTDLSKLLKISMDTTRNIIPVAEEVDFIETYIDIQSRRYGDRFTFHMDLHRELLCYEIPKLILQPLIENAIVHGIEPLDGQGHIEVNGWVDEQYLYFSVADNGVGSDHVFTPTPTTDAQHIGLNNVDQRIKLYYGEEYGINWHSQPNMGTVVFITIPTLIRGDY